MSKRHVRSNREIRKPKKSAAQKGLVAVSSGPADIFAKPKKTDGKLRTK